MIRTFIIADSRSRISIRDNDVIDRHLKYVTALQSIDGHADTTLLIIQPSLRLFRNHRTDFGELSVLKLSALGFIGLGFSLRRRKVLPVGVISGDPWVSFIFANIIRFFLLNKSIPIQVQIHSELSKKWTNISGINKMKIRVLPFALKSAESIRVVSIDQIEFLSQLRHFSRKKIVCIPVPLNGEIDTSIGERDRSHKVIAFVGRIQSERNIELFISLTKYFLTRDSAISVYVIGDGPDLEYMKSEFRTIGNSEIVFMGHLSSLDLDRIWKRIGVLISTATTESYGRAMREALCHGTSVLALESNGAARLKLECTSGFELFTEFDEFESIYNKLEGLFLDKPNSQFIESQLRIDTRIPKDIANSWVTMLSDES